MSHINQSVFQYILSIFHKLPVKSDNAEFIIIAKDYNISKNNSTHKTIFVQNLKVFETFKGI